MNRIEPTIISTIYHNERDAVPLWKCYQCGHEHTAEVLNCVNGCHWHEFKGKATIYWWNRWQDISLDEVRNVRYGFMSYAQYPRCPYMSFNKKGKSRGHYWYGHGPEVALDWVVVVRGWMAGMSFSKEYVASLADAGVALFDVRTDLGESVTANGKADL